MAADLWVRLRQLFTRRRLPANLERAITGWQASDASEPGTGDDRRERLDPLRGRIRARGTPGGRASGPGRPTGRASGGTGRRK
jgi:hypothetical protein